MLVAQQSLVDPGRAPAGHHTLWAYCHVPNGSTVDMTAAIERQIERFAPGFRDVVLARSARGPALLEAENPNYVGGDINGGAADLRQVLARPVLRASPLRDAQPAHLPVLVVDAARRRRPRHVRLPRRAGGAARRAAVGGAWRWARRRHPIGIRSANGQTRPQAANWHPLQLPIGQTGRPVRRPIGIRCNCQLARGRRQLASARTAN